jgi:hypothetical protein
MIRYAVAGLFISLGLAGCAATDVSPQRETSLTNLPKPRVVLVYKFGVNVDEVRENQSLFKQAVDAVGSTTQDERATKIGEEVADAMADELVTKIGELGLPAQRATRETRVPADALVITGQFLDIDEGNRARRLVIGFGAGESKLDASVQVLMERNGGYSKLTSFTTHADSGAMPGAAATMGAGAAAQGAVTGGMAAANVALGGVKTYRSDVANMASRSAAKAVEYLSDFFARQGWISWDKVKKPIL